MDASKLIVILFEQEDVEGGFHNRAFLTEHGGVALGNSISLKKNKMELDEVTLMQDDIYHRTYDRFLKNII